MPFHAVFQKTDGWWIAWVEEIPGANAQARTIEEARENLKEAVRDILEVNREIALERTQGAETVRELLDVASL